MSAAPRTYADIDSFITMLMVACEDTTINSTLQDLLSRPDAARRAAVLKLAARLRYKSASAKLIDAIVCLLDDNVAEKAYQSIYHCARKAR